MAFTSKENEAEARERLRAFWAGASPGRPALHAVVQDPAWQAETVSPKGPRASPTTVHPAGTPAAPRRPWITPCTWPKPCRA